MISYAQAIILGLLQGVAELFPISSLGHSVLLPHILNWQINESDNFFIVFLVATHLATALVLLAFFYKDWILIIKGFFRSIKMKGIGVDDTYARLSWLIVLGTIPAGILGLLFEKKFRDLFSSPILIAVFLILNGVMLFGIERIRRRNTEINDTDTDKRISRLTWKNAIGTGFAESLALLPGFSRTGAALGGGLAAGLDHEASARFSFLLATPIILAASVLKLPELIHEDQATLMPIIIGFISALVAAYFSISFLTKYFKTHTLKPFAAYCVAAGFLSLLLLLFR